MRLTRCALLLLAVAACGGDDGPPPELLGSWRVVPSAFDSNPPEVAARRVLTFNSDGSLLDEEGPLRIRGSYEATDTELTTIDAGFVTTEPYLVATNADQLLLGAMTRREGSGDTGIWHRSLTLDGKVRTLTVTLRSDLSAHIDATINGEPSANNEGQWARNANDLEVTVPELGGSYRYSFVEDRLGTPYERP